jgi:proteasome accessory factor C
MTQPPRYVERLVALPRALGILALHPDGLPLRVLADELGVDVTALRETILAFYNADEVESGFGLRPPVLEFVGPEGEEADPDEAEIVRIAGADPARELGVEHLSAADLAALHQAGRDLLQVEPDNVDLASALEALESSLLPVTESAEPEPGADVARRLHDAVEHRRRVRIVYARAWRPGVADRVIEPYRLVRTRRGWECDAGPLDEAGGPRSFLVSGVRELEVLDETFDVPGDVDELLAANRSPTTVELVVPPESRWVVDRFAETVCVIQEDETGVSLRAELLPPVRQRLGLILVIAGSDAFVIEPAELEDAGRDLARELLLHHGQD